MLIRDQFIGDDGILLSIAEAFQSAMPELSPPPPPACKGCKAVVGVQEVSPLLAASLALQFVIPIYPP